MKYAPLFLVTFLICSCGNTDPDGPLKWTEQVQTDEFGDPIPGAGLLRIAEIPGELNGEPITVKIIRDDAAVGFSFHEKHSGVQYPIGNEEFVNVRIKDQSDEPYRMEFFLFQNMLFDDDGKLIEIARLNSGPTKIYLDMKQTNQFNTEKFLFTLHSGFFK